MSHFDLLREMDRNKDVGAVKKERNNIKYQQYEVVVEGKERIINIPLREIENFEGFMSELDSSSVSSDELKKILRKFRGTRFHED